MEASYVFNLPIFTGLSTKEHVAHVFNQLIATAPLASVLWPCDIHSRVVVNESQRSVWHVCVMRLIL